MKHSHVLHRLFLITMVSVCATAVVILVKNKVEAAVTTDASLTNNAISPGISAGQSPAAVTVIINGVCSGQNGTTSNVKPSEPLCITGVVSGFTESNTNWTWKCNGSNGGASPTCGVRKAIIPVAQEKIVPTVNTTTTSTLPPSNNVAPTVKPADTVVKQDATPAQPPSAVSTQTTMTDTQSVSASSSSATSPGAIDKKTLDIKKEELAKAKIPPAVDGAVDNTPVAVSTNPENSLVQNQIQSQVASENAVEQPVAVVKSQVIAEPVVIAEKNLVAENNPKVSGQVNTGLKIDSVAMENNNIAKKSITLKGKSEPNAIITIYIFSNDPIVITIKADENGNWNYELDKELANGQHEAYVAVIDEVGKIVSKSEPIAFVKTAQAASVIPVSELSANQSPMENSSAQYILMAIGIMSVCLVLALIAIGFLTYKQNPHEGIN